jgi:predicted nucleic acid-binding protein
MQVANKPVRDWKNILLDTSVILALFRGQNHSQDESIIFVNKLVSYLCNSKTGSSEDRTFYISTITLSELITKETGQEKIRRVLKALDSENVEFLSFDIQTALEFNIRLTNFLDGKNMHKIATEMGFKTQDFGMARQWISKDYMIAMTGMVKGVDVILTFDKNTFYPVCQEFQNTACILPYPVLFDHTEEYIISYYYEKVPAFLNNTLESKESKEVIPLTIRYGGARQEIVNSDYFVRNLSDTDANKPFRSVVNDEDTTKE